MRDLIAEALTAAGTHIDNAFPMRRLDPAYRAVFADGSTIRVRYGRDAMRDEIARTCGSVDAAAFDDFVDWLRRLYLLEMPHFIDRNFDSPLGLLSSPVAAAKLIRLGGFGRLGPTIRRKFRDPRLHRLFSFQALYAGLSPESALALYAVITYMDSIEGVWFPDGGMHAVGTALALAAEKAGVDFRYSEEVPRSSDGRAPRASPGFDWPAANSSAQTRSSVPSTCRSPTNGCCRTSPPRERCGAVSTPRRRSSGMSVCRAFRNRTSRTTTSISARSGELRSTPCSIGARRCRIRPGW
jgi:hypothetical protein